MCQYCELKFNEKIGITCGSVLLKYTATVITKDSNDRHIMSSNDGSSCYIHNCPKCGKELK